MADAKDDEEDQLEDHMQEIQDKKRLLQNEINRLQSEMNNFKAQICNEPLNAVNPKALQQRVYNIITCQFSMTLSISIYLPWQLASRWMFFNVPLIWTDKLQFALAIGIMDVLNVP